MVKRLRAVAALSIGVAALACSGKTPVSGQPTTAVDRKLGYFTYMEEGDLVSLIVNTRATQYRDKEAYIPLEVAIANRGLKELELTRESFTLVDAEGNRYPCAAPGELLSGYDPLDLDRRLQELSEIVFNRFATFTFYPSKFSPTRAVFARTAGDAVVHDNVSLPKFGYTIDMIYFPQPKTGIHKKRFELHMNSKTLPEPVFVKFMVI